MSQVRHDVVELKDDVAFDLTTDQIDGLLEDEKPAAGVMVVAADLTISPYISLNLPKSPYISRA